MLGALWLFLTDKLPDMPHDRGGPLGLPDVFLQRMQQLLVIELAGAQPQQAALHVIAHGRQRLGDLVGQGGGHFAERGEAQAVGEFALVAAGEFEGADTLGDVEPVTHYLHRSAVLVAYQPDLVMQPAIGAVAGANAIFAMMMAVPQQDGEAALNLMAVVGMNVIEPELRIADEIGRRMTKLGADIVADESRRPSGLGFTAVDHRRGGGEQMLEAGVGGHQLVLSAFVLADLVFQKGRCTLEPAIEVIGVNQQSGADDEAEYDYQHPRPIFIE